MTSDVQTSSAIPEEWLSAYLDNELSTDEREQVESALEASPSLRAQLEELKQVSDLLRGLPSPQLAAGFAKSLPLDPPVRRSAGLPWKFGMTAGSLLAASLVAGVLWIQTETAQSPEMRVASSKEFNTAGSFDEAVAESAVAAPALEAEELTDGLAMTDPESSRGAFGGLDSMIASEAVVRSAAVPRSGDLIPLLESNDENVAVVEWVVVDVNEAFGQLQLTLASMGVPPAEKSDEIDDRGERFLAVFVEADETVMQSVMAASARQRLPVQQQLVKNTFTNTADLEAYGPLVAQTKADTNAKLRPFVGSAASRPAMPKPAPANVASSTAEPMQSRDRQPARRGIPTESETTRDQTPTKERQSAIPDDRAARFSVDDPQQPPASLAAPAEYGAGQTAKSTSARPEASTTLANNYQMPLQLTQESVDRIAANNSLTPVSTVDQEVPPKPQRLLIVFKPAE